MSPEQSGVRPHVIYVSYDGAAEALGQSQIIPYLERLASECVIDLVSFEKPGDARDGVASRLAACGIRWHPLPYHRRPPVASTALDVIRGARRVAKLGRQAEGPLILHARSYVPALIATQARLGARARLLFDIRAFWADERVEGGLWRKGGLLFRIAKRYERRFFADADAVVTLTRSSLEQIRRWMGTNEAPVVVIPTCVDLDRFTLGRRPERGPRVTWAGSISGWYDFDAGVALARQIGYPLSVLTQQTGEALAALRGLDAEVRTLPPELMADELAPGDIGLCTVRPLFSKSASAPTRVGEYLASGMPVAALAGVGDLDEILRGEGVGVTLRDSDPDSIAAAAAELRGLAADPETPARCREAASRHFSLERGVELYRSLYRRLSESPT